MRLPQINYFIGTAYEALGNKSKAKSYFTLSAGQTLTESAFTKYYQGLSYLKIGKKENASAVFNALIEEGNRRITMGSDIDFFAKFGEQEAENVRLSNAYLLKGLGYKGLGDIKTANEYLKKAVELSASNLFANVELNK